MTHAVQVVPAWQEGLHDTEDPVHCPCMPALEAREALVVVHQPIAPRLVMASSGICNPDA